MTEQFRSRNNLALGLRINVILEESPDIGSRSGSTVVDLLTIVGPLRTECSSAVAWRDDAPHSAALHVNRIRTTQPFHVAATDDDRSAIRRPVWTIEVGQFRS